MSRTVAFGRDVLNAPDVDIEVFKFTVLSGIGYTREYWGTELCFEVFLVHYVLKYTYDVEFLLDIAWWGIQIYLEVLSAKYNCNFEKE